MHHVCSAGPAFGTDELHVALLLGPSASQALN